MSMVDYLVYDGPSTREAVCPYCSETIGPDDETTDRGEQVLHAHCYESLQQSLEEQDQQQDRELSEARSAVSSSVDKLILFYVYGDEGDVPWIVRNPPENLEYLLREWSALDQRFCASAPSDSGADDLGWKPVNEWLRDQGVDIFEPAAVLHLDNFPPS